MQQNHIQQCEASGLYLHCHEDMSILKKLKLYDNSLKFGSMCIKKQALPETHSDRKW